MPCPGHMGSIELRPDQYIYHPLMVDKLALMLNLFCTKCNILKFRSLYHGLSEIEQNEKLNQIRLRSPSFKFMQKLAVLTESVKCDKCNSQIQYKAEETEIFYTEKVKNEKSEGRTMLLPKECLRIVQQIAKVDLELLGLTKSPPENMILTYLPIAPLTARPNIKAMGGVTRDQLSDEYRSLLCAIS